MLMQIHISQAEPGCILAEDILGQSSKPIMLKQTVLKEKHIKILDKFLITNFHVLNELENGQKFTPCEVKEQSAVKEVEDQSFSKQFKQTVHQFKEQFFEGIAYQRIDIPKLRKVILPLFKRIVDHKGQVLLSFTNVEDKDYFFHKQIAVSCLSYLLANQLNYSQGECIQVGLASLLADTGMIQLEDIQHSSFSITSEKKLQSIKNHPVLSYRLIEDEPLLTQEVKISVLQHHERFDGSGYPLQLTEDKIHRFAKNIAVCEEYYRIFSSHYIKNNTFNLQLVKQLEKYSEQILSSSKMNTLIQMLMPLMKGKNKLL